MSIHIRELNLYDYYDTDKQKTVELGDEDFTLQGFLNSAGSTPHIISPEILAIMAKRIDEISARLGLPPMGAE